MKIIVEETEVELDLPDREVTLRDVADEVEEFLFTVGKVPVGLAIDGVELDQEDYERRQEEVVSGEETFKFNVVTLLEFLVDNLEGAEKANLQLIESLKAFCSDLQEERDSKQGEQLVLEMQHFFDFWLKLSQLLPETVALVDFGGKKLQEILENVCNFLKEIVEALEEDDLVLATDLFQYEVTPLLEAVAKGVPQFKEELAKLETSKEPEASS